MESKQNSSCDYAKLKAANQGLMAQNEAQRQQIEALNFELKELKRLIFGSKRERFILQEENEQQAIPAPSPSKQLTIFDTLLEIAPPEQERVEQEKEKITYERKKKKKPTKPTGRRPLPAHLRRVQQIIEPEGGVTSDMKRIGEEITESLEYQAAELYVRQIIRPKYVKIPPEKIEEIEKSPILIADMPSRPIDKGIAGASLLAYIIVSKMVDHLPLHRQQQIFKRQQVNIARSTIGNWFKKTAELLLPLWQALKEQLLEQAYLQVDESSIKVLDPAKEKNIHRGYFWVYYCPLIKLVFFDYHKGRDGAVPQDMLSPYKGYMQVDGYSAYEQFTKPEQKHIQLFFCMAHARRKFEKALDNDYPTASWMMAKIQQLYAIEREAKTNNMNYEQRYLLRQQKAVPILDQIDQWFDKPKQQKLLSLSSGATVEAIKYYFKRKQRLRLYTTDGSLEIDNNFIENTIRPLALGRHNFLFAGSQEAAKRLAIFYSFMGTCKMNQINPMEWLTDVLKRIPNVHINKIKELLPHNWKMEKENIHKDKYSIGNLQ